MKRTLAILLAAMMLISMAACQSAPQGGNQTQGGNQEQEKFVVGICQLTPHEALDAATKGFVDALKEKSACTKCFMNKLRVIRTRRTWKMRCCCCNYK